MMRCGYILQIASSCLYSVAKPLSSALRSHTSFSLLYDVLEHHQLLTRVDTAINTTFFAPNNDALIYLANFGINLTTADPSIAHALIKYGLVGGVHSVESIIQAGGQQRLISELRPPLFSNVTAGQAVKLYTNTTSSGTSSLLLETGLQILTHVAGDQIPFDNGVIYGTSTNMVLPENISDTTRQNDMKEFYRLIERSGCAEILNRIGDATFFIPSDKSIIRVRPLLDMLSQAQLTSVVLQHVIRDGVILYEDRLSARTGQSLRNLDGGLLSINIDSRAQLNVNGSRILQTDMLLYNGVGHLIDDIILPAHDEDLAGHREAMLWSVLSGIDSEAIQMGAGSLASSGNTDILVKVFRSSTLYALIGLVMLLCATALKFLRLRRVFRSPRGISQYGLLVTASEEKTYNSDL